MTLFTESLFMRILGFGMILGIVYLLFTESCGVHEVSKDCTLQGDNCGEDTRGLPGRDGSNGQDGRPGHDGSTGPTGPQGDTGSQGTQGPQGIPGAAGPMGADGIGLVSVSETVLQGDYFCPAGGVRVRIARDTNRNGTLDNTDSDLQVSNICNGVTGPQGPNGVAGQTGSSGHDGRDGEKGADAPVSPFLPVSIVDPCGDAPGIYDEVFIRLQNGILLVSFSDNANGQNTRFSVLSAGSYVTTDGSSCKFSVDSNSNVYGEHY